MTTITRIFDLRKPAAIRPTRAEELRLGDFIHATGCIFQVHWIDWNEEDEDEDDPVIGGGWVTLTLLPCRPEGGRALEIGDPGEAVDETVHASQELDLMLPN